MLFQIPANNVGSREPFLSASKEELLLSQFLLAGVEVNLFSNDCSKLKQQINPCTCSPRNNGLRFDTRLKNRQSCVTNVNIIHTMKIFPSHKFISLISGNNNSYSQFVGNTLIIYVYVIFVFIFVEQVN